MGGEFPSQEWLDSLVAILNADERYAGIARSWEGDVSFIIRPDGTGSQKEDPGTDSLYLDLWHGKCRSGRYYEAGGDSPPKAAFVFTASYGHLVQILRGQLDPMQAMLTRKLMVSGNMAYILRNVPVVLDFVRCCRLAGVPD